jgi:hypothetical protein
MSVHIIVCVKSVVKVAPRGVTRRTPDNSELNPFDRPALEAALRVRQSSGGTVTALSMGPDVGAEALAEAQAMGVDEARASMAARSTRSAIHGFLAIEHPLTDGPASAEFEHLLETLQAGLQRPTADPGGQTPGGRAPDGKVNR